MTLDRWEDLQDSWADCPPVHISMAAWIGWKGKGKKKGRGQSSPSSGPAMSLKDFAMAVGMQPGQSFSG